MALYLVLCGFVKFVVKEKCFNKGDYMKLIDIIEYLSAFDAIKIYVNGDYYTTVPDKGHIAYNSLKLTVVSIYAVYDDTRVYLAIDLKG